MEYLVGYTGFVGSNLVEKNRFDGLFNSKNVEDAYGKNPDVLVYAGVRAEMFLANKEPDQDLENIHDAITNIKRIHPKKLILISTIAVYDQTIDVDEDYKIQEEKLTPYGRHRYQLEQWVQNNMEDYLIVRLPALYGNNLKKNFIYDYINLIPKYLSEEKFKALAQKNEQIRVSYEKTENGLYKCKEMKESERKELRTWFQGNDFHALYFTDSRSVYQFYNLAYLWRHIKIAMEHGIRLLNLATEPVRVSELYRYLRNEPFVNHLQKPVFVYDYKTKYADIFGGRDGYLFDKEMVMQDIKAFIQRNGGTM